jgi:6-phosphogluconolactonase (cycloisomerase 2 family)
MDSRRSQPKSSRFLAVGAVLALVLMLPQTASAAGRRGNVYVATNQPDGNSIMVFHRDASGLLTPAGQFASGGNGAGTGGDPLGSQGAVALSEDESLLFAVNAGSNSVSAFAVFGDTLNLLNTVPSGGTMPISVAVKNNFVYVLNAGGTPNISGFRIGELTNRLNPLAGSTRNLPGGSGAAPAQVSFSPDGSALIVTEKGTNTIDTFTLKDGRAQAGVPFPSSGSTPFGFDFADDVLIVSEVGGGPGASTASSYSLGADGSLSVITPALGDTQSAACWLVAPKNGRFAYSANTGSGTISTYGVSDNGKLILLNPTAGNGSAPTDMALSRNSRFLYVRNAGDGTIGGFRIALDGSLTPITSAAGVPFGAVGIASR